MPSPRALIVLMLVASLTLTRGVPAAGADATPSEVETAFAAFITSWEREDLAGVLDRFTADAIAFDPTPPGRFEGTVALRAWAADMFAELSDISIRLTDRRVRTVGPTGWVTARYHFAAQRRGETADAEGHLSVVLVRQPDGVYRVPLFHASRIPLPDTGAATDAEAAPPTSLALSGLRLATPAEWTARKPTSRMRAAEFALASPDAETGDATLVVYYFGAGSAGSVRANLERWCGQFAQPDGRDSMDAAETGVREINGMTVHTLDVTGTYVAETRPGSGERVNEPDARLLAAIIETEAGPYYLKLVGPAATVAHWQPRYEQMLANAQPAPVLGGTPARHP